jgi:hypothetical protein
LGLGVEVYTSCPLAEMNPAVQAVARRYTRGSFQAPPTSPPPWSETTCKLYRPRVVLVPTFTNGGCNAVSVTDLYGRILGFHIKIFLILYAEFIYALAMILINK